MSAYRHSEKVEGSCSSSTGSLTMGPAATMPRAEKAPSRRGKRCVCFLMTVATLAITAYGGYAGYKYWQAQQEQHEKNLNAHMSAKPISHSHQNLRLKAASAPVLSPSPVAVKAMRGGRDLTREMVEPLEPLTPATDQIQEAEPPVSAATPEELEVNQPEKEKTAEETTQVRETQDRSLLEAARQVSFLETYCSVMFVYWGTVLLHFSSAAVPVVPAVEISLIALVLLWAGVCKVRKCAADRRQR